MLLRLWRKLGRLLRAQDDEGRAPPADAVALEPLASLGRVAVFAPHPDDESLGCGGLIALLKRERRPVQIVVMSDGAASHPGSRRYPPAQLAALRQQEARAAVARLGADPTGELDFLGLLDGSVPAGSDMPGFAAAVDAVVERLARWQSDTILAPLRSDGHADHRACFGIIAAALDRLDRRPRLLEYSVWATPGRAGAPVLPPGVAFAHYSLDVSAVVRKKRAAVACHRSQTTNLIDDAPGGFRLSPRVIAYLTTRWELFLEAQPQPDSPGSVG